ncbi:MAG: hypothetical protein ACJAR3_002649, partial [Roseivirga sp.]
YGFHKLTPLINSISRFELEQRENSKKSGVKLMYIRDKNNN